MVHSTSSATHLLESEESFLEKNGPQSPESSASSTSEVPRSDKATKNATTSTTRTKYPAPKPQVRKRGVAQIIKAPSKRPREVTVIASAGTGTKRKRSSPSPDSSDEHNAKENSLASATKRRKEVHMTDSTVEADAEMMMREAEEDAALDEVEKKIEQRKKNVSAKKGDAKGEAKKNGVKKARPQKKSSKEGVTKSERHL